MKVLKLHRWDLSYQQAIELQNRLAEKVRIAAIRKKPQIIAGLDCAFSKDEKRILAVAIVMKLPSLEVIEVRDECLEVKFPYIPGLLSFREAPVCIEAVRKLKTEPDLFIIDGQGIAHPRRLGLACHLGLFFDKPTIGCAKSRLIGTFKEPAAQKGKYSLLKDKEKIIGVVLRTRTNVKPVFVSVGNKCTLEDAIDLTLACTTQYRLPEPTRLAHQIVSRLKLKSQVRH
jgi:deoxyribonuclease V